MSEKSGRCALCHRGRLEPGHTTLTLERGDVTFVVKQVPALVCDTCGKAYIEANVTERLFRDAEKSAAQGAEVEIRRYIAA